MDTWSTQWKIFSSNHTFVLMALIQRCSLISTCILWSTTAAVCMRVSATRACSWLSWVHPAVLLLLRRAELRCYSAASCCAYSPSPVAVSCLAGPVCVPGSDHRSPAAVQCRGWWLKYRPLEVRWCWAYAVMQLVELYQRMYASGYKKRVLVNNITTLDNNTWTKLPYSFQPFSCAQQELT